MVPDPNTNSEFLLFQTEDGEARVTVFLDGDTVWLSRLMIAELFQIDGRTISEHIKNIYSDGEMENDRTSRKIRIVQQEGAREVSRNLVHYNLDMIMAIGYRVRSHRGIQFRRWATQQLKEYLVKGFVMDDERLKHGRGFDYFDDLLGRIRDIRASENRFYQKILDIYATSVDYDPSIGISQTFFATVQNKLHWAIHGQTPAELIAKRADSSLPNMGLTSWKGKKVRKADVSIARNYLTEEEIRSLNRIVTMYLDYAEEQAERRRGLTMIDSTERIDAFLKLNEREALQHPGSVSAAVAKDLAENAYGEFNQRRLKLESDQSNDDLDNLARLLEDQTQ